MMTDSSKGKGVLLTSINIKRDLGLIGASGVGGISEASRIAACADKEMQGQRLYRAASQGH